MIQILCFLIPPFICTLIFEKIKRKQFDNKRFLITCAELTAIINMVCFGVISVFFQKSNHTISVNSFSVSFSLKYLLLSFAVVITVPGLYVLYLKYKGVCKNNIIFTNKQKFILSITTSFFFSFTMIVFTPYDIFFGNQSDFVFGFSDLWWIMASFGLIVFIVLAAVFMAFPVKIFAVSLSICFSLTLCAYFQRMFFNFFITCMAGESLNTSEHPIWGIFNILIWLCLTVAIYLLLCLKVSIWKRLVTTISVALVFVQVVALVSLLLTSDYSNQAKGKLLTTDGLYEVGEENNIIVFVLDRYDFSFLDLVEEEKPGFYDKFLGFTCFNNTTSVYARTYPSCPYLLTGVDLEDFYTKPYRDCIDNAYKESRFMPDLSKLGFEYEIYADSLFVSQDASSYIKNYSEEKITPSYLGMIGGMMKCSLYFEMPYIFKPFFWFYDEINEMAVKSNVYTIDDAKFYINLRTNGLSVKPNTSKYKYIHMHGAHQPYNLNEYGERISAGPYLIQQSQGCMNIVYKYLEEMKKLDVYDQATIIITSDHGVLGAEDKSLDIPIGPIFFIKPAYAELEPLKVSHTPISHTDIFPTVIQAAGGDYHPYGKPIFSIEETEKRVRIFHYPERYNGGESDVVDYAITGNVRDFSNWKRISSKKIQNSVYRLTK